MIGAVHLEELDSGSIAEFGHAHVHDSRAVREAQRAYGFRAFPRLGQRYDVLERLGPEGRDAESRGRFEVRHRDADLIDAAGRAGARRGVTSRGRASLVRRSSTSPARRRRCR